MGGGGGQTEKGERGGWGEGRHRKASGKATFAMCRRQETETRAQLLCNVQLVSAL